MKMVEAECEVRCCGGRHVFRLTTYSANQEVSSNSARYGLRRVMSEVVTLFQSSFVQYNGFLGPRIAS